MGNSILSDYKSLIDIDYEKAKSRRHPQMDRMARAAQFAPFAALTGHGEAIEETGYAHMPDEIIREQFEESV